MKWNDLKKEISESIQAGVSEDGLEQRYRGCLLILLTEIHGDLDQISIAQRETASISKEILKCWQLTEERSARAEKRHEELHAVAIEAGRLSIEREKRMAQNEAENQKRWEEFQQLGFMKKPDDGTTN
jgi:hypothetical protein